MFYIYLIGIILLLWIVKEKRLFSKYKYPPGPLPLPLLGHLHLLGKQPHQSVFNLYRKYGSIFRLKMGSVEGIVITGPELMQEAFQHNDHFINRFQRDSRINWNLGENIATSNGDYNKYVRSIGLKSMVPLKIKKMEPYIQEEIALLFEKLTEISNSDQVCDPIRLIKMCSLNIIFRFMFNVHYPYDVEKEGSIIDFIETTFELAGLAFPSDFLHFTKPLFMKTQTAKKYRDANKSICDFIEVIVNKRLETFSEKEDPKDILDTYLVEYKAGNISKIGLICCLYDLVLAGTDTSANTVSALIKVVCNQPEIQEKMYSELHQFVENDFAILSDKVSTPYVNAVIKETLRRYPVVPLGIPHVSNESFEFKGYYIEKGTQVIQNINGSFLSEEFWDDPLEFIPERFLGEDNPNNSRVNIAFGCGARSCLGTALGKDELFLLVTNIFKKFKFVKASPEYIEDSMLFGLTATPSPFNVKIKLR